MDRATLSVALNSQTLTKDVLKLSIAAVYEKLILAKLSGK
jgi:hypothetical protein